ncbi:hypothetical protein K6Y31_10010 [Motilimonas cestriensis]|uniref:DUF2059 domain-containing protein n=1 Tax=Motilimonas cestriensis TaxID=2742685 RepID=A0ABS8W9F8_9GAMM|nr:hypothetical protein [Motilimonas cestriensis]MCE2595153.1 hypothetical protein [Motilimonas cestriensis]
MLLHKSLYKSLLTPLTLASKVACLLLLFSTNQVFAALADQDIKAFSRSLHDLAPLIKTHQTALLALVPRNGSIPTTTQLGEYIKQLGIEQQVQQTITQHGFTDIPSWLNTGRSIASAWLSYHLHEEKLNAFLAPYIEEYTQQTELTAQQQANMKDMIRAGTQLFVSFQAQNPDIEVVKRNQLMIRQTIKELQQLVN